VAARRWPRLISGLYSKCFEQHDELLLQRVVASQPRVDDRLLMLMWHTADRFGRMTAEGLVVPLALTHEAFGHLVGARRPTVSIAMKSLCDRGELSRRADKSWIVAPPPEDAQLTGGPLTSRSQPTPIAVP
jgi:CRP-like cAMP-binding protein